MAQLDVLRNPNPASSEAVPYLLDVQADLLNGLATRVVVPLAAETDAWHPARHLNPVFVIEGRKVMMSTAEIAGIAVRFLGEKVTSLADRRDEIIGAIDFVITGV